MRKFPSANVSLLIVAVICFEMHVNAQNKLPRFADYPVTTIHKGKTATLVLSRKDRMFETRLRLAAKNEKPNFAGHYIFTTWGCGGGCLDGAFIDAGTGRVYQMPFTICCWTERFGVENFEPIEFRLTSRLIIFHGARNEEGMGTYYYVMEPRGLRLIRAEEKAD